MTISRTNKSDCGESMASGACRITLRSSITALGMPITLLSFLSLGESIAVEEDILGLVGK